MSTANYVGHLIQCKESSRPNAVYIVFPEGASWIPNPDVAKAINGPSWRNRIQHLTLAQFETVTIGPALSKNAFLANGNPDSPNAIYLVTGEIKRHIMSPEVMDKYDFEDGTVIGSQVALFAVEDGANIT